MRREVTEAVSEPRDGGKPQRTALPDPSLDVSIVVPYYNPGGGCAPTWSTWCGSWTRRA